MATSPDGTRLLNNQWGIIFDAQGNNWRVVDGLIYENGARPFYSANVVELDYLNGEVWQMNSAGRWWKWNGHSWDGGDAGYAASPRAAPYPPGMNEYQPGGNGGWFDPASWSYWAPDNYRNAYSEIKTGMVSFQPYQWMDGNNLWLNGGAMFLAPGDAFGAYFSIQASMVSPDEVGHDYVNTITQPAGTTQSWGLIGVTGPAAPGSGSEQLKLDIHSGAFVNNGQMYASGSRSELDISAHNQYPGWSGDFYNNGLITLTESKMTIDAPMHGNGTVNIGWGSHLTMLAADDGGVFNLSNNSVLEFGAPKAGFLFLGSVEVPPSRPSVQFGGTINLWDHTDAIKLDDVTGSSLQVSHPNGAITHLNVLDNTGGVLAALDFGNTFGPLNDGAFTLSHDDSGNTLIGYGHAGA